MVMRLATKATGLSRRAVRGPKSADGNALSKRAQVAGRGIYGIGEIGICFDPPLLLSARQKW